MAKRQHIIELNGKKYDALTGKIIAPSTKPSLVTKPKISPAAKLDGVTRRKVSRPTAVATKVHRAPERSKTLMRSVVKKPTPIKAIKPAAPKPVVKAVPKKPSATQPSFTKPERVLRSTHMHKSSLISKFGKQEAHIKMDILPVKPAPVAPQSPPIQKHTTPPIPPSQPATLDPFQAALRHATSHTQPQQHKQRSHHKLARKLHIRPRTLVAGGGALIALVAVGFLAYSNVPNVAMRVAATRAGFQANLPAYHPAGFSLNGPITSDPGHVSVEYKSNSDNRDFKVIQRTSSWSSQALLDNVIEPSNKPYQTFQANGRTIYIYGESNATWVDGGVWYQIVGNSSLTSDQLLRIANSL